MAGYSGTPLVRKLGIKAGHLVVLVDAPQGFEDTLVELPDDVSVRRDLRRRGIDVALLFAPDRSSLRRRFERVAERLTNAGGLWVAWPKKTSGLQTDLDESVVRSTGLDAGLVDNKICAINETWSGLRFVYRLKDRPKRGK